MFGRKVDLSSMCSDGVGGAAAGSSHQDCSCLVDSRSWHVLHLVNQLVDLVQVRNHIRGGRVRGHCHHLVLLLNVGLQDVSDLNEYLNLIPVYDISMIL